MKSKTMFAVMCFVVACSSYEPGQHDDASITDSRSDGSTLGDSGANDAAYDGSLDGPMSTTIDVLTQCQPYSRTIQHTNSRSVQIYRWAIVPDVHVGDSFQVVTCGQTPPPYDLVCPVGAVCSGSLAPIGVHCYATDSGTFFDDKLAVNCGYTFEEYDASGNLTGSWSMTYQSIRVTY